MIRIFNDLKNQMQEFKPIEPRKILMYVCGITVYDSPHLGHARSAVAFDLIRKYLEFRGFNVKFVMNYTDVDDKMIQRANERNIPLGELAEQYIEEYEHMQSALRIKSPTVKPRATQEINTMIELIQKLDDKGFTYESGGSIYFDTSLMSGYKTLFMREEKTKKTKDLKEDSRINLEQIEGLDETTDSQENSEACPYSSSSYADEKRNIEDFALWKKAKPDEPYWESPWGIGRPGWHIECSAMSMKYLGNTLDIHGGGKDLKRPHHQNEIAQSECATGETFVNYWMHNGFLNINNEKMSKSLGNFIPLMDMLEKFPGDLLRFYFISSYYKRPMNFSMDKLEQAQKNLNRLQKFNITLRTYKEISDDEMSSEALAKQKNEAEVFHKEFFEAMDTDFNSVKAIGYLFGMINYFQKILNTNQPIASSVKKQLINDLNDIESFFNCLTPEEQVLTKEVDSEWKDRFGKLVEAILKSRKAQKKAKNWAMADALRDILSESNIVVNDNGNDYSWEFKK